MKVPCFPVSLFFLLLPLAAHADLSAGQAVTNSPALSRKVRIRGSLQPVEILTGQVQMRCRNGTQPVVSLAGTRTLEETSRETNTLVKTTGQRADLIAFIPGLPRTPQNQMLLTRDVMVRLAEGVMPSVFYRDSGATRARRPGFAPDCLILSYSGTAEALAAADRLAALPGVLYVENVIAVERRPEFIPLDTYFSGNGPAYSPVPKSDNITTSVMTNLPNTAAYQWWAWNVPSGQGPRNSITAQTIYGDFPPVAGQMADLRLPLAWDIPGPLGSGVTGRGVNVMIVDDGIYQSHQDLGTLAFDPDVSHHHNFFTGSDSPMPMDATADKHGTALAGLIGARRGINATGTGIAGIAPECRFQGVLAAKGLVNDTDWARAAAFGSTLTDTDHDSDLLDETRDGNPFCDICLLASSSTGSGDAMTLTPESWLWKRAVRHGATKGRDGKGVVYITSAGNGADGHNNTNYLESKNSIFLIPVAGVTDTGRRSARSNPGANIVCAAPTWGDELPPLLKWNTRPSGFPSNRPIAKNPPIEPDDVPSGFRRITQGIPTISTGTNAYDFNFNGTSASAGEVAGVVALMLELRPDLTARDVKEILLRSGRVTGDVRYGMNDQPLPYEPDGPGSATGQTYPWPASGAHPPATLAEGPTQWRMGSLGRPLHHALGAGLLDANKALKIAKRWTLLPPNPLPPQTLGQTTGLNSISFRNTETGGVYYPFLTNVLIPLTGAPAEITLPPPPLSMRLEEVEVRVRFYHKRQGDVEIKLIAPPQAGWHDPRPEEPGGNSRGRSMVSDLFLPHREDYTSTPWTQDPAGRVATDWTFSTVRHWGTKVTEATAGQWKLTLRDAINKGATLNSTLDDQVYAPVADPIDAQSQRVEGVAIIYHGTFGDASANDAPVILPPVVNIAPGNGIVQAALAVKPLATDRDGGVIYPVINWDFFNLSDIVPVRPAAPARSPFEYFPPGSNATTPGTPPAEALFPTRAAWPAVPTRKTLDPVTPAPPADEPGEVLVSLPGWLEFSADGRFVVLRDPGNTNPLTNFIHVRLNRAKGVLDVIPLNAGKFGINVIAENLTGISQPRRVRITVAKPVTYSDWISGFFSAEDLDNEDLTGPDADPDQDGFNNRLEYALGGDPLKASTEGTPRGQLVESEGQTYATLRFTRRTQSPDATFAVQFGDELMTWDLPAELVSSTENDNGTTTELWRSATPTGDRARVFGRVVVTSPP